MRDLLVICDLVAICCNNTGQLQTGKCTHAGVEQNWQGHCLSSRNFVAILSVAPRWDNGNYRIRSSEQYALTKYIIEECSTASFDRTLQLMHPFREILSIMCQLIC